MDAGADRRSKQRLELVHSADGACSDVEFTDGSFDAIIASNLLENVTRPDAILRKLRRWLGPTGRFITRFRTVRSLPVVEGLLEGRWLGRRRSQRGSRAHSLLHSARGREAALSSRFLDRPHRKCTRPEPRPMGLPGPPGTSPDGPALCPRPSESGRRGVLFQRASDPGDTANATQRGTHVDHHRDLQPGRIHPASASTASDG